MKILLSNIKDRLRSFRAIRSYERHKNVNRLARYRKTLILEHKIVYITRTVL